MDNFKNTMAYVKIPLTTVFIGFNSWPASQECPFPGTNNDNLIFLIEKKEKILAFLQFNS